MPLMKGHLLSAFRWFLLLCIVLNLGDAPYVDEILAEMGSPQVHVCADDGASPGQASRDDTPRAKQAAYENLLSNLPLPTSSIAQDVPQPIKEVAALGAVFIPTPPAARIERPPKLPSRSA